MPMTNYWAARVKSPKLFKDGTLRWKKLGKGISVIVGKLKKGDGKTMVIQAYRFDKKQYSKESAKKWLKKKGVKWIEFAATDDIEENYAQVDEEGEDMNERPSIQDVMRDFFNNTTLYEGTEEEEIPESEYVPEFLQPNSDNDTAWILNEEQTTDEDSKKENPNETQKEELKEETPNEQSEE